MTGAERAATELSEELNDFYIEGLFTYPRVGGKYKSIYLFMEKDKGRKWRMYVVGEVVSRITDEISTSSSVDWFKGSFSACMREAKKLVRRIVREHPIKGVKFTGFNRTVPSPDMRSFSRSTRPIRYVVNLNGLMELDAGEGQATRFRRSGGSWGGSAHFFDHPSRRDIDEMSKIHLMDRGRRTAGQRHSPEANDRLKLLEAIRAIFVD